MLLNCGVGERESPLDCKEIKLVNPKGNQSCIFIGRSYAEIETPILWPPDVKSWLIGKGPDAREDWRQKEKGMTEDEIVGWHHLHDVWVTSRSWWWTGKPGVLQSMGLQRVRHNWANEQGTRSHMWWLRVHMPQLKIPHATPEIPQAATKTRHSQISK